MRINFILKCTVCGEENYLTEKNKRNTPDRLEQKKYCPRCKKTTLHRKNKKIVKTLFRVFFFFFQQNICLICGLIVQRY